MSLTNINNENIFHREDVGLVRTAQEDSHDIEALTPNGDLFVVCDGMGGHVGGKQASSMAVAKIVECMQSKKFDDPIVALGTALQEANIAILNYAVDHPDLRGMGTTACILLLQDEQAYIAHIGDSRIYLYLGEEQELHRVTKDHSFVQTLVDAGQISDEEAESHPHKNRILKALGITPQIEPTYNAIRPKNGDIFLICSDGLSGMVADSTMERELQTMESVEQVGNRLIELALEAGGHDNVTLEIIAISNSPHSKSIFNSYNPYSKKSKRKVKNTPTQEQQPTGKSYRRFVKWIALAVGVICLVAAGWGTWHIIEKKRAEKAEMDKEQSKMDRIEWLSTEIPSINTKIQTLKMKLSATQNNPEEQKKTQEELDEAKSQYNDLVREKAELENPQNKEESSNTQKR